MTVRIRFASAAESGQRATRHASASLMGGFLTMVAVLCLLLSLWRLTADLGWTESFVIADGILSHWQVWMALTLGIGMLAIRLIRYGVPAEAGHASGDLLDGEEPSETVPGKAETR